MHVGTVQTAKATAEFVAARLGVCVDSIFSRERTKLVSQARIITYYLLRRRDFSFPEIGEAFNRDSSTVIVGVQRLELDMRMNENVAQQVAELVTEYLQNKIGLAVDTGFYVRVSEKVHVRLVEIAEKGYYGDSVEDVVRALLGQQLVHLERKI